MGKTVRDLDPEDTKGAMDAIEGRYSFLFFIQYGCTRYDHTKTH